MSTPPSEEKKVTLWEALLEIQREIKHAVFDSKNPHFRSGYASLTGVLDTIKPIANKHGVVITQAIKGVRKDYFGEAIMVQTLIAKADTGETFGDEQVVPLPKNDPQGLGSAITYGRRYGLMAIFAIGADDDDGNAASNNKPTLEINRMAAQIKEEAKPAPSAQRAEVEKKLSSALGFK